MKIILNSYFHKKVKKFTIIILLLFLFTYLYFKLIYKNDYNHYKVCVCTLGKEENKYAKEFVQHYEKYGVDKIFLYDNNDIDGERFEDVIKEYNEKGFLDILNWRGKKNQIYNIMNDCYKRNYKKYDWLIFYEMDEFIHLNKYTNVKRFLNEYKFKNCTLIYLNSVCHTDNNLLYYENKSLFERFPEIVPDNRIGGQLLEVKFILKGHIPNIVINNMHTCNKNIPNCNGFGNKNKIRDRFSTEPDNKYYYIDHFYSKSTEEFINKLKRGNALHGPKNYDFLRIEKYFQQSKITKDKIERIEKATGYNLTIFKQMIS